MLTSKASFKSWRKTPAFRRCQIGPKPEREKEGGIDRRYLICRGFMQSAFAGCFRGALLTAVLRYLVYNRDWFPIFSAVQSTIVFISYISLLRVNPQHHHQYQTALRNTVSQTSYVMARLSYGIGGLFWFSMFAKAYATPSPLSLNTNLEILFNNDFLG